MPKNRTHGFYTTEDGIAVVGVRSRRVADRLLPAGYHRELGEEMTAETTPRYKGTISVRSDWAEHPYGACLEPVPGTGIAPAHWYEF